MANKGKEHTCHSELFFKILGTWFVSFLLARAACFLQLAQGHSQQTHFSAPRQLDGSVEFLVGDMES